MTLSTLSLLLEPWQGAGEASKAMGTLRAMRKTALTANLIRPVKGIMLWRIPRLRHVVSHKNRNFWWYMGVTCMRPASLIHIHVVAQINIL